MKRMDNHGQWWSSPTDYRRAQACILVPQQKFARYPPSLRGAEGANLTCKVSDQSCPCRLAKSTTNFCQLRWQSVPVCNHATVIIAHCPILPGLWSQRRWRNASISCWGVPYIACSGQRAVRSLMLVEFVLLAFSLLHTLQQQLKETPQIANARGQPEGDLLLVSAENRTRALYYPNGLRGYL